MGWDGVLGGGEGEDPHLGTKRLVRYMLVREGGGKGLGFFIVVTSSKADMFVKV